MININKLVIGALVAGCLSIGVSFAKGTRPEPTAEQKAKFEEVKAKMEAGREAFKAGHDSLFAAHKAEIEAFIAAHKDEIEKFKSEHKARFDGEKAKRLEGMRGLRGGHAKPTEEQIAAAKAKFEEWRAAHPDVKIPTAPTAPVEPPTAPVAP